MTKHVKKHFLLIVTLFFLLSISCVYSSITPPVHAAEATSQEKGLTILNDVVGLDMTKYATIPKESPSDAYRSVVPKENVRYRLESNGSRLDMLYTFANEKLQMIDVLEVEGTPHMSKSAANVFGMAKNFLSNYQTYSKNSFYGELESMLDKIDANKNPTAISDNVKLEVSTSEDSTTFRWTYTVNGVEATSKCVVLGYKNGFLKYFIDNWDIYQIGSTEINLSEEEALKLAMEYAEDFSWKVGYGDSAFEVKEFNVTQAMIWQTGFRSSLYADTARSEYPLTLYPIQHVWVSLDKFYPGNVYGIEVILWADTKELCHIQARSTTLDPPADLVAISEESTVGTVDGKADSLSVGWIALPVLVALMLGTTSVWWSRKNNSSIPIRLPKLRAFKIGGVLFCFLLFSMTLLFPITTVLADNYAGRATIWGSESTGADMSGYPYNWRKLQAEITQQQETAQNISDRFNINCYDASNYQGNGSIKQWILTNISDNEQNYPRVAVVDFDHGVIRGDYSEDYGNPHFMFEDNRGTWYDGDWHPDDGVYDMDIYDETGENKTFFAFINTCLSAHINDTVRNSTGHIVITGLPSGGGLNKEDNAVGMPFAWTHRKVDTTNLGYAIDTNCNMSDDGYLDPDGGKFCYLGFPWGSAPLSQTINGTAPYYYEWVQSFFNYSLRHDMTVIHALDHASYTLFNCGFGDTVLYTGFWSIWPTAYYNASQGGWKWKWPDFDDSSTLAVYGNGNIKLYQPLLTVNAYDSSGNPLEVDVKIDDESVGTTGVSKRVFATFPDETHKITVTEPDGYTFQNFTVGVNTYTSKSIDIPVESDLTATAYFTQEPTPPLPVTVIIDSVPHDGYYRYHALTADNPIPTVFWTGDWHDQNPDAIIAVTASTLHYEKTFYLTEGYHNIEYAVSCYVGYWHATITAGGQVVAEQDTDVNNHVTTQIYVSDNPPPLQYRLTISAGAGGTTSPQPGDHWYPAGTPVQVTADPDDGYNLYHWLFDGEYYSNNLTVTVTMHSNHTLHAIFVPIYHDVSTGSVYLYNGQYHQFEVPFKIDGWEVGPTWYTYTVIEGPHSFEVPYVAAAWPGVAIVFDYWVVNGFPYSSSNPIGFTVQDDVFLGAVYKVVYG